MPTSPDTKHGQAKEIFTEQHEHYWFVNLNWTTAGSKIVILPHSSFWAFFLAGFAGLIILPRTTNVMGTMVAIKYTLLYAASVSCRLSTCTKRDKKVLILYPIIWLFLQSIYLSRMFCNLWKTYYETNAWAVKNHNCIQKVHKHKNIFSHSHFWRNGLLPPVNDCSKTYKLVF